MCVQVAAMTKCNHLQMQKWRIPNANIADM